MTLTNLSSPEARVEPGSFRDRNGRVFYRGGEVYRCLGKASARHWEALSSAAFFAKAMEGGEIVRTEEVSLPKEALPAGEWAKTLRHERIPFISYPYEWSFGMLKDAALRQLDLLSAALEENFILKDSSAFNIQWRGAMPVFIDTPSFEPLAPNEPWVGYRQFCQLFLYPLMLQAYKNVPFQDWLRGNIDGIEPQTFSRLMSPRDLLRPGVLTHGYLHGKLQSQYADSNQALKSSIQDAGFGKALIEANVRKLRKLVQGLPMPLKASEWGDYTRQHSYTDGDMQAKEVFVSQAAARKARHLVWDLGANTGQFSRLAAEHAGSVVAMDIDQLAVERNYQRLKAEGNRKILPMVMNVAQPSPNQGWRGLERKGLPERGTPDLTLCLALIHHLVISANIHVEEFVGWLAGLRTDLVIEFVTKQDPMVQKLLRNKVDHYQDYEVPFFEDCMARHFRIVEREALQSGTRILYYAEPLA